MISINFKLTFMSSVKCHSLSKDLRATVSISDVIPHNLFHSMRFWYNFKLESKFSEKLGFNDFFSTPQRWLNWFQNSKCPMLRSNLSQMIIFKAPVSKDSVLRVYFAMVYSHISLNIMSWVIGKHVQKVFRNNFCK